MPDRTMPDTPEEAKSFAANSRRAAAEYLASAEAAEKKFSLPPTDGGGGGNGGGGGAARELDQREKDAAEYHRMTPAEKVALHRKDPARLQQLADEATQLATDQLIQKGFRP